MRAVRRQGKRIGIGLLFFTFITFTLSLGSAVAEEKKAKVIKNTPAKAAPKQAKATTPKSRAKAVANTPAKVAAQAAITLSEDDVLALFDTFTIEWMKKLEEAEQFHKAKAKVTEAPEGFSAEYTGYLPPRYTHVKKTESTDTPYVGILTYYEEKLRCTGKTKEEAIQGPFSQVEQTQVSEIFRFTKGKWEY